jgi:hypothetical protein
MLCAASCAPHARPNPADVVKTKAEAIAIAGQDCGYTKSFYQGPWHANYDAGKWILERGSEAMVIAIDARTGQTEGCVIVTR